MHTNEHDQPQSTHAARQRRPHRQPPNPPTTRPCIRRSTSSWAKRFMAKCSKPCGKSQGKAAYFNGGQAEEIFTQQLDQVLTKKD